MCIKYCMCWDMYGYKDNKIIQFRYLNTLMVAVLSDIYCELCEPHASFPMQFICGTNNLSKQIYPKFLNNKWNPSVYKMMYTRINCSSPCLYECYSLIGLETQDKSTPVLHFVSVITDIKPLCYTIYVCETPNTKQTTNNNHIK